MEALDEQEIHRRRKLIDQMVKVNAEATIADFQKVIERLEEWEFTLPELVSMVIWPQLYTIGYRRWPPAKVYTGQTVATDQGEYNLWRRRDQMFHSLVARKRKIILHEKNIA